MYWTLELASKLEDAPWPATKDELIDYATRSGAPLEVIENLNEIEDEGEIYESIEDIWPDYPSKDDFFFNEEEYERHPRKASFTHSGHDRMLVPRMRKRTRRTVLRLLHRSLTDMGRHKHGRNAEAGT